MYLKKTLFVLVCCCSITASYLQANDDLDQLNAEIRDLSKVVKKLKIDINEQTSFESLSASIIDIVNELRTKGEKFYPLVDEFDTNTNILTIPIVFENFVQKLAAATRKIPEIFLNIKGLMRVVRRRNELTKQTLFATLKIATLKLKTLTLKDNLRDMRDNAEAIANFNLKVWNYFQASFNQAQIPALVGFFDAHYTDTKFNVTYFKAALCESALGEMIEANEAFLERLIPPPEIQDMMLPPPTEEETELQELRSLQNLIVTLETRINELARQRRALPTRRQFYNELTTIINDIEAVDPKATPIFDFNLGKRLHGETLDWLDVYLGHVWEWARHHPQFLNRFDAFQWKLKNRDSIYKSSTLVPLSLLDKKLKTLRYSKYLDNTEIYNPKVITYLKYVWKSLYQSFAFASPHMITNMFFSSFSKILTIADEYLGSNDPDLLEELIKTNHDFLVEFGKV